MDADQGQISMHIFDAITLQYAASNISVQGNLAGLEHSSAKLMEDDQQQHDSLRSGSSAKLANF
jgi:hypothetical protein